MSEFRNAQIKKAYPEVIFTSALNGDITQLISALETSFNLGELFQNDELTLISDSQIALLRQLKREIQAALNCYRDGMPIDILNVNLYGAWEILKQLVGDEFEDTIIDNIFRKYCLGK